MAMTDKEINEAVAKRLGWTLVKSDPTRGALGKYKTLAGVALSDVPDYCHSIEAAWDILLTHPGDFGLIRENDKWISWFRCCEDVDAHSPQMAICLAFLKI